MEGRGSVKTRLLAIAVLTVVMTMGLTVFQNCSSYQAADPSKNSLNPASRPASGNGDGYTGITMIYPKTVESGDTVTVRILDTTLQGISYRLIEGDVTITPLNNGTVAMLDVADDYIGNIVIEVTAANGQTGLVEIQVVTPVAINNKNKHPSFGTNLNVGKWVFVSVARKNLDSGENAGRVTVFKQNQSTDKVNYKLTIDNPLAEADGTEFGDSINSYQDEILISSKYLNQVFHYDLVRDEVSGEHSPELSDVITVAGGKEFGSALHLGVTRMIVSDPAGDGNKGMIYTWERATEEDPFIPDVTLTAPEGYEKLGRSFQKEKKYLYVSARKDMGEDVPAKGVILVYDLPLNQLVQIVEREDVQVAPLWGRKHYITETHAFIRNPKDEKNGKTTESVDVYSRDSATGELTYVQTLNGPGGLDSKINYGADIVSKDGQLFIGANNADSVTQENSGLVYMYKLNSGTGLFEENGYLTPDFEAYDFVTGMGRSLAIRGNYLYVAVRGKDESHEHLKGSVYSIPLETPAETAE